MKQSERRVAISLIELAGSVGALGAGRSRQGADHVENYPDRWKEKRLGLFLYDPSDGWRETRLALDHCSSSPYGKATDPEEGEFICSAVGDIDGDGNEEVVCAITLRSGFSYVVAHAPAIDGCSSSLVSNLDGFDISFVRSIAVGDLDDDGVDEIVIGTKPSGLVMLLDANGSGYSCSILDREAHGTGTTNTREVIIGDADNDGRAEVLAANAFAGSPSSWGPTPGSLSMLKQSRGEWIKTTVDDFGGVTHSRMVTIGDAKGNGQSQVVANQVGVYVEGHGVIRPKSFMQVYESQGDSFSKQTIGELDLAVKARGFALGDVDGDGKLELIVGTRSLDLPGYGRSYLFCYKYVAAEDRWSREQIDTTGEIGYHAVAVLDVDDDGKDEVIASDDQRGVLKLYKREGKEWREQVIRVFSGRIFVVSISALELAGDR